MFCRPPSLHRWFAITSKSLASRSQIDSSGSTRLAAAKVNSPVDWSAQQKADKMAIISYRIEMVMQLSAPNSHYNFYYIIFAF
jgi:hypothetical protein